MNETQVSDAQATFEFIARHTSDVIVRANSRGVVTYASPSIGAYGHAPEEIVGTDGLAFFHPDDRARVATNTAALLRGETSSATDRQHRFQKADGDWVWVEGAPHVVRDDTGAAVEIINVFRDVSHRRAAEERAREQAELFETAFERSAIGRCLMGLDGRFLKVNAALCRLTGHPQAELLSMNGDDIAHPDEIGSSQADFGRLVASEIDSFTAQRRFLRPDGSHFWVELTVGLVRDAQGAPLRLVVEAQDLTARFAARAALQESERRYRLIAENTTDLITMSDSEGRITYLSPSIRQLGFEAEDLLGKTFAEHVHPEDASLAWRSLKKIEAGGTPERIRWRARHNKTGEWVWLESAPNLLRDPLSGATIGYLDVVRDISRQVEQEAALVEAQAKAEAAATAKAQFLANMSHEIRTPLTAVLGFTGLLGAEAGLSAEATDRVAKIAAAGNGLLAIVNDILDFSKLEAGSVEIRPRAANIAQIARETLDLFAQPAAEKGLALALEVHPDLPAAASLDPDRLRQILINLCGNAVKFTSQGGVTLRAAPVRGGQAVRFEVEDTGAGLDREQCKRLFRRFSQIDGSAARRHAGTGLGLAISKGLAEAMGGEVGVTSTPGSGSVFHLTLPLEAAELQEKPTAGADMASIVGMRVMVVDDNANNRELARRLLEIFGAHVCVADGGAEALSALADLPVDAILMDLRMPDLDGRDVLARLRAIDGPNRLAPVLAFTADAEVGDGAGLAAFDGVVRKPIDPKALAEGLALAVGAGRNPAEAVRA